MTGQSAEHRRRLAPAAIVAIVLTVLCGISLYIRIALPYDEVFVKGWVWFRETDSYWHIRNIETLVHNFPRFNSFDPYIQYPGGGGGVVRPFFDWLIAVIILLVSWGRTPAQHLIEVVAAYMPAILGTLTLIPVYLIGKELFNRWVGVISAALVAILPGEFMNRSLLGFVDHHVAETLFSTVCMLFLIMAIKQAQERNISFSHLLNREWSTITKFLIYTLLAGFFLGIYLLSWQGGLLLVFIVFAWLVLQFIVNHLRHKSSDYLCIVGTPLFLIAFLMLLPVLGKYDIDTIYRVSLPGVIVLPIVLTIISRLMAHWAWRPVYYPLTLLGLTGIGLVALRAVDPSLFYSMLQRFGIFQPAGAQLTVTEMQPLSPSMAWDNFTISFFISFVSLAMLIHVAIREKSDDKALFLVWSIMMLVAVLGQRRFGYYYVVNVALLTGYASWKMLDTAGLSQLLARSSQVVTVVKESRRKRKKTRERAKPKALRQPQGARARVIVVGIVIFFLVFFPNIPLAKALASHPNIVMDEGWYTSLLWLKDNSPEPFGHPDFYYKIYPPPDEFEYPDTAYGVMSWWDYGYFIMQIAHRIPNTNPGHSRAAEVGQFFTAQNESLANKIADELGSKYVVLDFDSVEPTRFFVMAEWTGQRAEELCENYYVPSPTGGQWRYQLYPAYYKSIAVRLYNFDGKAVVPTESIVISYIERVTGDGKKYKEMTGWQSFPSYEDAQAYVASQASGNHRIVGMSPFSSPVPLEELSSYRLVHQSEATTTVAGRTVPTVKIFEYLGAGEP